MNKKNRFLLAMLIAAAAFAPRAGLAATAAAYNFEVDTGTLSQLLHGPNALGFFSKHMVVRLKTETPLNLADSSTAPVKGLLAGTYMSPKGPVELELQTVIRNRELETNYAPPEIDAIANEWEETYGSPAPLKKFRTQTKRLVFREGEGLVADWILKHQFEYQLEVVIGYDATQKKLQDKIPDLNEAKKFIVSLEGDNRGRTLLENNVSGLPALVFFETVDGARLIHLHHPRHDITYDRDKHTYAFNYSDDLTRVSKLTEVRRVVGEPFVRKFILEKQEAIQISVKGGDKIGFDCVVTRMNSGEKLPVRLEGKKVTAKPEKAGS